MTPPAELRAFRLEEHDAGIWHLVFDMADRPMNVFSNRAIDELAQIAAWLKSGPARGLVMRSAKPAFCAGADLNELGQAYDEIMALPKPQRSRHAFDHFFRLSSAIRALETAGKPVAAAIAGLALGGGCEFALGAHYRVMADAPGVALGLPESLVGLLPGGGGTQRLPRLLGIAAALPVLLDGARLSPAEAVAAGAADALAAPGTEVAAAEAWLRTAPAAAQPWDRPGWQVPQAAAIADIIATTRARVMAETAGHYPAPLAILDCLQRGLPEAMDRAIAIEMEIFAALIQRPEPRNMIRANFLGKLEYEKRRKAGTLPEALADFVAATKAALAGAAPAAEAPAMEIPAAESAGLWFEAATLSPDQAETARNLAAAARAALPFLAHIPEKERGMADYATIRDAGFPAYLGGPFTLAAYLGSAGMARLVGE